MWKKPLLLAFCLGVCWIWLIPNVPPVSDQEIYDYRARMVASGMGYIDHSGNPTAYWAPGYAFYLSFFYWLLAPIPQMAFFANLISYLCLVGGVYSFGKLLYSEKVGCFAAWCTALYPSFLFYNTILASEVLFSALLIWAVILSWKFLSTDSPWMPWGVLAGLFFGLATLVRPVALIMPAVLITMGLVQKIPLRHVFLKTGFIVILMVLTCVPWGVRNQRELGSFILVSANLGDNLLMGNHPNASGVYDYTPISTVSQEENLSNASLSERNKVFTKRALEFIYQNPGEYLILIVKRAYRTLRSESLAAVWNKKGIEAKFGGNAVFFFKLLTNAGYFSLLLGCLYSFVRTFRKKIFVFSDWIPLTMVLLLSTPFLFILGGDRFHLPLVPYLIFLACTPLQETHRR